MVSDEVDEARQFLKFLLPALVAVLHFDLVEQPVDTQGDRSDYGFYQTKGALPNLCVCLLWHIGDKRERLANILEAVSCLLGLETVSFDNLSHYSVGSCIILPKIETGCDLIAPLDGIAPIAWQVRPAQDSPD